jgi:hypothetical protein
LGDSEAVGRSAGVDRPYITEARASHLLGQKGSVHSPPLSLICNNSKGGSRDKVVLANGNKVLWDDPNPSPKREKEKRSSCPVADLTLRCGLNGNGHGRGRGQVESYMGNATLSS